MENTILWLASSLAILLPVFIRLRTFFSQTKNHPPTPPSLPILGHLHLLKLPLHRCLHNLSSKYGPIFSLRLGTRRVIVVSSPSGVEDCLAKNDIIFANRFPLTVSKYISYNCTTLGTASYGDHWRNLRRISTLEVFSSNRLNAFLNIRREEIMILLNKLYRVSSHGFARVELKTMLLELTFNIVMRMIAGKRYYGEDVSGEERDEAEQFRAMISEIFACSGFSYMGDYLPISQWIDLGGFLKRVKRLGKKTDSFLQGLIDEHRRDREGNNEEKDTMISHLLSLQESEPEYYTDEVIKGLVLDIIFAGTDTSATAVEWVMCNLLNYPEILQKARNELDKEIGKERLMEESDISKVSYLHIIIKETLRLYPPGPLLLPHLSSKECTVEGYYVGPDTMLLVNVWAIQRDPDLWDDAIEFKPERFEINKAEDENYKLFPFGLGRRACPGMGLANRVVGLAVGSLIQCFEWKRISDQKIDMTEGVGLTMPKAEPLEAFCMARNILHKVVTPSL